MAKINLTTQHNQENLNALASSGVLICMIVTVVGIKLWWFKHRLSLEQKTTPTNSATGGTTPAVILSRRNKQQKYKKDKRYSQQIYESVEVHGVFRQKREDDLEIQRPVQLPPVRIRQTSESASSLILPPPHTNTKRRDQVHSTAFEDLEIATPLSLTTASSSDLAAIPEFNTKITLTFEEFKSQFKLKEHHTTTNNELVQIPVPPLRLNRSSSALIKPEKPECFLKSSQSINTIPEFHHKVVDKNSAGFSSPKEDLTKIDCYANFGNPKAAVTAGYIKYEEVDNDLYERELNMAEDKEDYKIMDNEFCERPHMESALKSLRCERVTYNKLNESPDGHLTEEYNFNDRSFKINEWQTEDFTEENFIVKTRQAKEITKKSEFKDSLYIGNSGFQPINTSTQNEFKKDSANFERIFLTESKTFKEEAATENNANNLNNEQKTYKFVKDYHIDKENPEVNKEFTTESKKPQNPNAISPAQDKLISKLELLQSHELPKSNVKNNGLDAADNKITTELNYINDPLITQEYVDQNLSVEAKISQNPFPITVVNASFEEDHEIWPQFEEKIVTPQVTVRRFNNRDLETQNSSDENDELNLEYQQGSSLFNSDNNDKENGNEVENEFSATENRPASYASERSESHEIHDREECQEAFSTKFYNQVRTFMTSTNLDGREVSFDSSVPQQIENENNKESAIKQRRPTGFNRQNEYCMTTLNDDFDGDTKNTVPFNTVQKENELPKVKFENGIIMPGSENETEKFTLNHRRPTGFVRSLDNDESDGIFKTQVKFDDTTVFKDAKKIEHSIIKQRRPTGFVKKSEVLDFSDNETTRERFIKANVYDNNDLKTNEVHPSYPTVRFLESERSSETDSELNTESLVKQRRPTGYVRRKVSSDYPTVEFIKTENSFEYSETNAESLEKTRTPTGYVRQEVFPDYPTTGFLTTEKSFENSQTNTETLIKQFVGQKPSDESPSVKILQEEESLKGYDTESFVKHIIPTENVSPNSSTVIISETEKGLEDYGTNTESLLKQRRPTECVQQDNLYELEKQVSFQLNNDNNEKHSPNEALRQRRPTGFVKKEETTKNFNFQLNSNCQAEKKIEYVNEQLKARRPTGFVTKKELFCINKPVPIYQPPSEEINNHDFDDHLWQELEKDVAEDFSNNFEEEFAKIRHSYEMNEAHFLELKDELKNSPTDALQQPLGFGKTIEDDWENFEKLNSQIVIKPLPSSPVEKIKITFSDNNLANTTSILKETKLEEDIPSKPRKSKVTFHFKTEEHVIPARKSHNCPEEETDYNDDVYDNLPKFVKPQPVKRVSKINNNNESSLTPLLATPTSITLFGTQISTADNDVEDSWSAIRKHRNMTEELQSLSTNTSQTTQPTTGNMPPKPTYRNPMAQLAIQRAKEVRSDMDGFKSRSINNRKPEASRRQKQKLFNLSNVDYEGGTEA